MNVSQSLIAAAFGGILIGATGCASSKPAEEPPVTANTANREAPPGEKHGCKGQNACRHQGGCKTDTHACKAQNECRSQGGCKGG
jgi:hypothetical protein